LIEASGRVFGRFVAHFADGDPIRHAAQAVLDQVLHRVCGAQVQKVALLTHA